MMFASLCNLRVDCLQDDEMSWLDKSCLQLVVRRKDKPETLTFQVSPSFSCSPIFTVFTVYPSPVPVSVTGSV